MAALTFNPPPQSICILRLSAIGDVTHMLPVIATLQTQWPDTRISWIIGTVEYQLVKSLPGIEFIVFNKNKGLAEYQALRKKLSGRHFDVLLMMQVAMRANLLSLLINAKFKIGFDKARARDFHGWFCHQQIEGAQRVHVLDTFFQFLEKLGITQRNMNWLLKANAAEQDYARSIIGQQPCVIINPCSSARKNNWRNWPESSYAEVIDYLMQNKIQVILSGGPAEQEQQFSQRIIDRCHLQPLNLVAKTSLGQLLALLEQASCLIAPDTGPAHMGTVAGTPVIGLYASSNPLRTGPYNSQSSLINAYPQALNNYKHKTVEAARWGERVRAPDVMELISVADVITRLKQCIPFNN